MTTLELRLALFAACAIASCQPTADAAPKPAPTLSPKRTEPEPPPQVRFERDVMLRFHMHSSFDTVRVIERLLVRGKLEDAGYFAHALSTEPTVAGMETWAKQIALVRERAAAVAAAPGLDEACRREAKLAEACASCHADAGALPEFQPSPLAPADQPTLAARMARHQWAVDRVWEGMIGDADDAWRAGLDVLAATPLPFSEAKSDRAALARRLQQLADQARHPAKEDLDERARLYGEILVTCAACHTAPTK